MKVDVTQTVAFAGKGEHGIGSGFDAAADHASEVDAKEWEGWIGHGVDQVTAEMTRFGAEFVVFAPERHDADLAALTGEFADPVAVQSGGVDEPLTP